MSLSGARVAAVTMVTIALAACGGPKIATNGPAHVALAEADGLSGAPRAPARQRPPPPAEIEPPPFPPVARAKLGSGLGLAVVTSRALPIVQVRLVVRAGTSYGATPGVGDLVAGMIEDGGTRTMTSAELRRRVEALGADLSARSTLDALVVGMGLTRDGVDGGLAILSEVVREPRLDAEALRRAKARAIEAAEQADRSSGAWAASYVLWREISPDKSPYRYRALLPSQIAKLDGVRIREFHRSFFLPKNAELVVVGDIDLATAKDLAERHFAAWTGGEPPRVELAPAHAPEDMRIFVAHRPKSVRSEVYVGTLAPPRGAAEWPRVRVATQVLGGAVASRLLTKMRGLADGTSAHIDELAHGEQRLVLHAGTETEKTIRALTGLLEGLEEMRTSPPTAEETDAARRYLGDTLALGMETIGSFADMLVLQASLGLPDGCWDSYRAELRATDASAVGALAPKLFAGKPLVVVAGDADVIGPDLARFGEVTIVDPDKQLAPIRTIPKSTPK
jgi:predicted Zn-dependent peptidase